MDTTDGLHVTEPALAPDAKVGKRIFRNGPNAHYAYDDNEDDVSLVLPRAAPPSPKPATAGHRSGNNGSAGRSSARNPSASTVATPTSSAMLMPSFGPDHSLTDRGGKPDTAPPASVSMASVEDQTALFEDILHPEMLEALDALQQLDNEEAELVRQLRQVLLGGKECPADYTQALCMELDLRRKEKVKTMETFRKVEEERNENTRALVKEMKRLRKKNAQLMGTLQARNRRQEGNFTYSDTLDVYDWVVDIGLLGDLADEGWKVVFSDKFYKNMIQSGTVESNLLGDESVDDSVDWQGAVIAVVGLYDKGKTFVLNQITQANLPSGKKVSTKGLSFKHVNVESTNFVLLDSAGSYSPVKVVNELSVAQKEATELFLLDLIFDLSDYFIFVVNDFTSLDQRYLDKLTRGLQSSTKVFREVIVIHNLKEVTSAQVLAHVWETQVTQIYSGGSKMITQVAAVNPATGKLEDKHVEWFKTKYSRHICLAHHDSPVGRSINPWTISLLRYWLKSVFVPVDRKFSVVNAVIHYSNKKLSTYFKDAVRLTLQPGPDERIKFIRPANNGATTMKKEGQFRLPQVALDASGLMLTRPDSFMPPVDIVVENDLYCIYMDVPGLSAADITLARQNVLTIIKGSRSIPYGSNQIVEKQERKYGDFTMTFSIPHTYERKMYYCHVENGVLSIKFKRDIDDCDQVIVNNNADGGLRGSGSGQRITDYTPLGADAEGPDSYQEPTSLASLATSASVRGGGGGGGTNGTAGDDSVPRSGKRGRKGGAGRERDEEQGITLAEMMAAANRSQQ